MRSPGLRFHARPQENGRGGRSRTGTGRSPAGFESAVSACSNHAAKNGADGGNRTLMSLRSPTSRAGAYAVSPHPQKLEHPQGRASCSLPYRGSPSLSIYGLDALKWSKREELHLRSPHGRRVYSALHLLLCHASMSWELGRDSHPRPFPYEGTALTAAPPSYEFGGPPR